MSSVACSFSFAISLTWKKYKIASFNLFTIKQNSIHSNPFGTLETIYHFQMSELFAAQVQTSVKLYWETKQAPLNMVDLLCVFFLETKNRGLNDVLIINLLNVYNFNCSAAARSACEAAI